MTEQDKPQQPSADAPAADAAAPAPPAGSPSAESAPAAARPHGSGRPGGPGGRPGFGRGPGGPGGPGGRPGAGPHKRGKRNYVRKKKVCRFCVDRVDYIDYKKAEILAPFLQERGKILPRRMTGTCARHQRWLTVAIKRAQNIAMLPFAAEL